MTSLTDISATALLGGELRAGGTDLMSRPSVGPHIDLRGRPELSGVVWREDGTVRVGALTTIADLAADPRLAAAHPCLARTAAAVATPEIRAVATLGGNLLQRNRCPYFRSPAFSCFQDGGHDCPAQDGLTLRAAVVRTGPCLAPHPSSLAVALLACEASVEVHGEAPFPVGELYGDGADPTRDHLLPPGAILAAVVLPPPRAGERAAYHRATARAHAEWPLAEAAARLVVDDGRVRFARVAVGGVARVPLRLTEVEQALLAGEPLEQAAARAAARCTPTSQNAYKIALLTGTILEALEQAAAPR
ncbi:FAD binding domain-containing protein [Sphaerisporangium rhizosphaerae]|uniref:FAD binding domain-containing protein n=1 Tax=Sphaerisporangium rhizosphaerae TaxID=2269375 RepID=A0ABW2NVH4_9ACTN